MKKKKTEEELDKELREAFEKLRIAAAAESKRHLESKEYREYFIRTASGLGD